MLVEPRPFRLTLPPRRGLARLASPANPLDRGLDADPEPLRRATGRRTPSRCAQNAITQVLAVGPSHPSSPKRSTIDSHSPTQPGIPAESEIRETALAARDAPAVAGCDHGASSLSRPSSQLCASCALAPQLPSDREAQAFARASSRQYGAFDVAAPALKATASKPLPLESVRRVASGKAQTA